MTTRPTDEEIRAWAARHDLQGSLTDLRCAFEDAATLCGERQAARDGASDDARTLNAICDLFQIGSAVRDHSTILTNIENVLRRSECLWAIERDFFTREVPDEDGEEGETVEDCDLSWGAAPAEYVAQFRAAIQSIAPPIASVSDALNFLEEWALSGNTLHGDDIQQFHATIERIAPVGQTVSVPEWTWNWLMDYCRENGASPANHNSLFKLVSDMRTMFPNSPQPQQAMPDGWLTIETAPVDGTPHLRGLWVNTSHGEFWDVDSGYVDDEGDFVDLSGDYIGWDVTDYSHWLPLPTAPAYNGKKDET